MKKYGLVLLICLTALFFQHTPVSGADKTLIAHGDCGDGMTWILDSDYRLSIAGEGAMKDYAVPTLLPWMKYRPSILKAAAASGVTAVGNNAFNGCTVLEEAEFARSVKTIGNFAFSGCKSLRTLNLPERLTTIGNNAFADCTGLTEMTFPVRVSSIGQYAFKNCTGLTEITLPDRVETLKPGTFQDCANLERIGLPAALSSIEVRAFSGCVSLQSISISATVDSIADHAFENCTSLEAVYYAGSEEDWKEITSEELREQLAELGTTVYFDSKTEQDPVEPEQPLFSCEIIDVSVSGGGVAVTIKGEPAPNCVLYAASYDLDGHMLNGAFTEEAVTKAGSSFIPISVPGAHTIAAYLLDEYGRPAALKKSALAVKDP